ncbi:MAG: hypothetical protein ACD_20C00088G0004 [uncultured bacterium]|nr:MAG: hypothetical protein ACD_20C00088G0004 [uncultured bacterium]
MYYYAGKAAYHKAEIKNNNEIYDLTERFYKYSIEEAQQIKNGNNPQMANSYVELGNLYILQNDFLKAETVLLKSYGIFKNLKDVQGEIFALNNLGIVYSLKGDLSSSNSFYLKALLLLKQDSNKLNKKRKIQNLLNIYNNLSAICIKQGKLIKAIEYQEKIIDIFETNALIAANQAKYAENIGALGILYYKIGKINEAEMLLRKSNDIYNSLQDKNNNKRASIQYYLKLINEKNIYKGSR